MDFGTTNQQVIDRLNLTGDNQSYAIGSGRGQIPSAWLTERREVRGDYVASRLPELYRKMLTRVEGNYIVEWATEGQVTATIPLPLAATPDLILFKNFFTLKQGRYSDRRRSQAMVLGTDYTRSGQTVTFTEPLGIDDHVLADYTHTGASASKVLQMILIDLVAGDVLQAYPSGRSGDYAEEFSRQAYSDLARFTKNGEGRQGLQLFDDLKLCSEMETRHTGTTIRFPGLLTG